MPQWKKAKINKHMSFLGFRKDFQWMNQNSQEEISGSNIPFLEVASAVCGRVYNMCFFWGFYDIL